MPNLADLFTSWQLGHWLQLLLVLCLLMVLVLLVILLRRQGLGDVMQALAVQKELLTQAQERLERTVRAEIAQNRGEFLTSVRNHREEMATVLNTLASGVQSRMTDIAGLQKDQLDSFARQLIRLTQTNEEKLERLRAAVETRLEQIQAENTKSLDQMRATVDEKLQGTLEQRLGESFRQVSERLEQVHKGLGEMQTLATGVGDLKRVLTNVKTRGNWGEIQLEAILEHLLAPDQFARNVRTGEVGGETVEFALRLPGPGDGEVVWLPVDAKFPLEDYERLVEAQEQADAGALETHAKNLTLRIKAAAKSISEKYLAPPKTTDFAIMFLPHEGLYAEVLRRPGLADTLQREHRVVVAGPTTFAALLNSLQMGFRTLAIQQRSSEVWRLLGAVKSEFGKFGEILVSVKKKLDQASHTMDDAARRSRAIEKQLRDVQALPVAEANLLLSREPAIPEK